MPKSERLRCPAPPPTQCQATARLPAQCAAAGGHGWGVRRRSRRVRRLMTARLPPTRRAPRPVSAAGAPNFLPSHRPFLAHLSCCAFPRGARRANGRGSRVRRGWGWWRGMWRASGGAPSARLRASAAGAVSLAETPWKSLSAKFGGITIGSILKCGFSPPRPPNSAQAWWAGGDKACLCLALPRRFPTSAKSVDKPLFYTYHFSPTFCILRTRRPGPC